MTRDEFDSWFAYHRSCFPGIATWLQNSGARVGTEVYQDVISRWYKAIRNIDYEHAEKASDLMFCEEEKRPAAYEQHPATIRRIAAGLNRRQRGPQYTDGQRTYHCPYCRDRGIVRVREQQRPGVGGILTPDHASMACYCEAGRRVFDSANQRHPTVLRYDPSRHVLYDRPASDGDGGEPCKPFRMRELLKSIGGGNGQ